MPPERALLGLIVLLLLAGCSDEPQTKAGESGSPSARYGGSFSIFTRQVDGYGLCTFAYYDGGYNGGLTLVGCKP